jgi:hypothetical protein
MANEMQLRLIDFLAKTIQPNSGQCDQKVLGKNNKVVKKSAN